MVTHPNRNRHIRLVLSRPPLIVYLEGVLTATLCNRSRSPLYAA